MSGIASAPAGTVAMFENPSPWLALAGFLISNADAEITGLQPVSNGIVELIYVDDNGIQIGDVLAEAQLSITGNYELSLPEGVDFAANLVLRITGANNSTLDAQVTSQTVNIDPYSDYLLDKLIANGTQLATLAVNEVVLLKGKLEAFDLTAGANMSEMLAALEALTGQYIDNSILEVINGPGDAAAVAGDYHGGEFGLGLQDNDAETFGTVSSSVLLDSVSFTSTGGANLQATFNLDRLDAWYSMTLWDNGASLFVENTLNNDDEQVTGTVDGTGAITFSWEFEEELSDNPEWPYGYRYPAGALRMTPVGDTGIYLGNITDTGVRYGLQNGVLDPNNKQGDEANYTLIVLASKSVGLTNASLEGDYGMVGLIADASDTGVMQVSADYGVVNFDGIGIAADQFYDQRVLRRAYNSAPTASTSTDLLTSTYTVAADGSLTVNNNEGGGFVADGGNVWTLFTSVTTENNAAITDVEHSMAFGVKLPVITPDMSGRDYQMHSLSMGYGTTSTLIETLSKAHVTFNQDGTLTITIGTRLGVERSDDTANIQPVVETVGTLAANVTVTVGPNGSIDVAEFADGGGMVKLDGFVSTDGDLLTLRATYVEGNSRDVGILIGALSP